MSSWESKGLYNKTITPYATSDNTSVITIIPFGSKVKLKFNKNCLKESNNLTYYYG